MKIMWHVFLTIDMSFPFSASVQAERFPLSYAHSVTECVLCPGRSGYRAPHTLASMWELTVVNLYASTFIFLWI